MKSFTGLEGLTNALAEKKGITKKESYETVKDVIDVMREALLREDSRGIQIVNFLTLTKVVRKAKLGRNPMKPEEEIHIPERNGIKLSLGKEFSKELNTISVE